MKTKNLFAAIIVAVLFTASYIVNVKPAKSVAGNMYADSTMSNHNHGNSTMMNNNEMMAMMQKCSSKCDKKSNVKSGNSIGDSGTKKGSYGYFQYQRQKDNEGK
ncbi:MAG: hypothetical protein ACYDA4_03200 [Ignavibacteriaceae bacterium]